VGGEAANQGIGVVEPHHHAAESDGVEDELPGLGAGDAFALAQAEKLFGVLVEPREFRRLDDLRAFQVQMQLFDPGADGVFAAEQDGECDFFVEQDLAGAQNFALLAFGEDDASGLPLRLVDHVAHDSVGLAERRSSASRYWPISTGTRATPDPWRPAPPRRLPK